jgi:multidrug efflux system membrane fusion protein
MINKMKTANGKITGLLALCLLAATSSGLMTISACAKKPQAARPPVPVVEGLARRQDLPVQISAIGNVEAYSTVQVRTLISGQLTDIYIKEGQDVKKGQLIMKIDPRPFEAALRQAESVLARDTAQAEYAEAEERRYQALAEKDYVPKEQYDQFRTNAASSRSLVESDKAAVDNARVQLTYCYIYAPTDGVAGSILVNQGNVVKANDVPLLVINQVKPIYVSFSVPEQDLPDIKKYSAGGKLAVLASLQTNTGSPEKGFLTFIDNMVDPSTGTIRLKGTFANEYRRLWPGQFIQTVLELTTLPGAVTVPSQAVQSGQNGNFVFVIKPDMTVEPRPVETGIVYDGETQIKSGIAAGERVVTDGQLRLVPGAKVVTRPPVQGGLSNTGG